MLDLESFARLQAQLRRPFAQREDVLRAAHLDEDGLRMESAHWSALLAASESTALRTKYRAAYARASAAAAAAEPPSATAASPPASSPPPAAAAEVEPAVVAPRREVASFMQAPLRAAPWSPMPAPVHAPSPPMIIMPPVATPPPVVAPQMIGPPAVVAAPPPVAQTPMAPQAVTGTLPPDTEDAPKRVPLAQRGTAPVDAGRMRAILDGSPTPFAGKTSPARLDALRAATPNPEQPGGRRVKKATMMANAIDVGAVAPSKTLPFAKEGGDVAFPAFPDLTVDRYAALAAELQAKGPTDSVLGRYAIASTAALSALHAEHARRFTSDPGLRARFEERKAHFLAFMAPTR